VLAPPVTLIRAAQTRWVDVGGGKEILVGERRIAVMLVARASDRAAALRRRPRTAGEGSTASDSARRSSRSDWLIPTTDL
jgi:hypothetical protein